MGIDRRRQGIDARPDSPASPRASISRKGGHWQHDDFDVFDGDRVIGRIYLVDDQPEGEEPGEVLTTAPSGRAWQATRGRRFAR